MESGDTWNGEEKEGKRREHLYPPPSSLSNFFHAHYSLRQRVTSAEIANYNHLPPFLRPSLENSRCKKERKTMAL